MAKSDRGFASMNAEQQRRIASKGGRVAHEKGVAHEWTTEEARAAGRRGGMVTGKHLHEKRLQENLQQLQHPEHPEHPGQA